MSTAGGAQARWRADGKELFYVALDARLMAVPLRSCVRSTGAPSSPGAPVPLFATHISARARLDIRTQYVVSRTTGQRFLMNTQSEDTPPISVILNWSPKP